MQIANQIGSAHSDADKFMDATVRFLSACPICFKEREQRAYTRAALGAFLRAGYKIEGYCTICNEFWQISGQERRELAQRLSPLGDERSG